MEEKDYRVVGVVDSGDINHVFFSKSSVSLCDKRVRDQSVRMLDDFEDLDNLDCNVCEECVSLYNDWISGNGSRAPTVRCRCDVRISLSDSETCDSVVSAFNARELCHPNANRDSVPVCPDCYRWIKSIDTNSVETSYEEADPWLETSLEPSIDQQS